MEHARITGIRLIGSLCALFAYVVSLGQEVQVDTLRNEHDRVVSIHRYDGADTWSHLWYYRSGKLQQKRVELEEEDGLVIWDTTWNKDGTLNEAHYNAGERWIGTDYDERGILESTTEYGECGGVEYNFVTRYYPTGVVRERYSERVEGKVIVGVAKFDSLRTLYREDGTLMQELRYASGELHGVSTDYYPSGAVESIELYTKGRLMEVRYFDADGRELSIGDFLNGNGMLAIHEQGVQVSVCRYRNGHPVKRSCKCPD